MEQLRKIFIVIASYGEFSDARQVNVAAAATKELAGLMCQSLNDDPASKYRSIPLVAEVLEYASDVSFSYEELSVVSD